MEARLLGFRDACELMGFKISTARWWLCQNKFPVPTVQVGGRRMVFAEDIDNYLAALKRTATTKTGLGKDGAVKRGPGRPRRAPPPLLQHEGADNGEGK